MISSVFAFPNRITSDVTGPPSSSILDVSLAIASHVGHTLTCLTCATEYERIRIVERPRFPWSQGMASSPPGIGVVVQAFALPPLQSRIVPRRMPMSTMPVQRKSDRRFSSERFGHFGGRIAQRAGVSESAGHAGLAERVFGNLTVRQ